MSAMKQLPRTDNPPAVRTEFSDDRSWENVWARIQEPSGDGFVANLHVVNDPAYDGLSAEQLPSILQQQSDWPFVVLIDKTALSHQEHPVLVVDLLDEPGRTVRVVPSQLWAVENNLSIANMGFAEFADAAGPDGIFRGWS